MVSLTHRNNSTTGAAKHSSSFKGVWWNKRSKKWHSELKFHGKSVFFGRYDSEVAAAKAVDAGLVSQFPLLVPDRGLNFRE